MFHLIHKWTFYFGSVYKQQIHAVYEGNIYVVIFFPEQ